MNRITRRRRVAAVASLSILAFTLVVPAGAAYADQENSISVADLADSSQNQQRWISEPGSRIVLNPSHSQTDDTRVRADNSLDTFYYINQNKKRDDSIVRNGLTRTDLPMKGPSVYDEGDETPVLSDTFGDDSAGQWATSPGTGNGATLIIQDDGGHVTLPANVEWGSVSRNVQLTNGTKPVILVSVANTTGKWALKVAPENSPDITIQDDTTATGTFAYDLSALNVPDGNATIKLFTSDYGETTFRAVSIHAKPAFEEDFTDLTAWRTDVSSNNGAYLENSQSGLGATLTSPSSSGFGAVARSVTVDLSVNPVMTIAVDNLSQGSQWALKLANPDGSGDFQIVQNDTPESGVFSYNIAALTGMTGEQTFGIKLFSSKTPVPTSATFTRISFHRADTWIESPSEFSSTWNPQSLDWSGSFSDAGRYSTKDIFVDENTVARLVEPGQMWNGHPTLQGNVTNAAKWDSETRVLSSQSGGYTRAVAFPESANLLFFDDPGSALNGSEGNTEPSDSTRTWVASLPSDSASSIGFGWAVDENLDSLASASASALGGVDLQNVRQALETRTNEWNDYLARVPSVGNYGYTAVSDEGVSEAQTRAMYYRSFVNLKQTVVPPQPESGISHHQVATGKAATYNGGSHRNRASASWDSLLGIQYLAYTEPELAWDSLIGMMADVEEDGGLNGESLPSRKAQTAWMLYSITGDESSLAAVYPAVKAHMKWSSENLAWNIDSHFPGGGVSASDERDAEFVVSLIVDLESASRSAQVLGKYEDAEAFSELRSTLIGQYKEWFFMPDGRAVQYLWTSRPDATYDQRKGTVNYVNTGLLVPELTEAEIAALMTRFYEEYDPAKQFAGTASHAIKAPDAQFIAYGLIESGHASVAQIYLESVLRDVVRTHAFSEVYQEGPNGSHPISRGESPTTFGMAQVIDNLWILNGYRSDKGTPTFVQLPGATGSVHGLSHMGKSLNVDLADGKVGLTGEATGLPGVCESFDVGEGESVELPTTCASVALSKDVVEQGAKVTVQATKLPSDTEATVELHSDPIVLGTGRTTDSGTLEVEIMIPTSVEVGDHSVVVKAGSASGSTALAVKAKAGNGEPGGGSDNGKPDEGSNAGGGESEPNQSRDNALAYTGGWIASVVTAAFVILVIGLWALIAARRRHHGQSNVGEL